MSNKRIPQLPGITSASGEMSIPIYDPLTDITSQIIISDLLPGSEGADADQWQPDIEYSEGEIKSFNGEVYVSLEDNNIDNPPDAVGSTFWAIGVKGKSGLIPWAAGIFTNQYVTVLKKISGVWGLYYLDNATRPYNSTDFNAELTAGDWAFVVTNKSDRGIYNQTVSGDYPAAPLGSGVAGAIDRRDEWEIGPAGATLNGEFYYEGTLIRARVANPGNTPAKWKADF